MSISTTEPTAPNCNPPPPTHHDPGFPLSIASEKVTVGNVHIFGVCMHARETSRASGAFSAEESSGQERTQLSASNKLTPVFFLVSEAFLRLSTLFRKNSDWPHQANKIFHIWTSPAVCCFCEWLGRSLLGGLCQ